MAASRLRAELAEQARIKAAREEQERREREALRTRYPTLGDESIALLYRLQKQYQYAGRHLVEEIGEALVHENERPGERALLAANLFHQGHQQSFPALSIATGTLIGDGLPEWFHFCNVSDAPTLRRALAALSGNPNVTPPARSGANHVTIE